MKWKCGNIRDTPVPHCGGCGFVSRHAAISASRKTKPAIVGATLDRCIFCQGTRIVRKGLRHKKLETVQLWRCNDCDRVFTPQRAKGKTYPLKPILESLILYYRGEPRVRVVKRIKDAFRCCRTGTHVVQLDCRVSRLDNLCSYARAGYGRIQAYPDHSLHTPASLAGLPLCHSSGQTQLTPRCS